MAEYGSNILGISRTKLELILRDLDVSQERAKDIFKYIHREFITDFNFMPKISRVLQNTLTDNYIVKPASIVKESIATDGTIKWLIDVGANNFIETVYIPEKNRATLCISSQIGCMLNCSFCSTAKQGFNRNLSANEIIGQLWLAQKRLYEIKDIEQPRITNVVFMGMGEPLLNTSAVFEAISIMNDDYAYGLSHKKVTVSTSGVVPGILELAKIKGATLAISMHAAYDELRDILTPINRKYPISKLIDSLEKFVQIRSNKDKVLIEYIMLKDINDSSEDAQALADILEDLPIKVNLIPFNTFPGSNYECSDDRTISEFWDNLDKRGIITTIRKTRGENIAAACGQLAGEILDRTKRNKRYIKSMQGSITANTNIIVSGRV
ncbi:MAG: 23S rRNA (adenine(2503)-C(2))-methyltransferase RlmN [Francisellaceae bacterium]|jgi:23S rRNA (adenine2503-C2)-methyltransferase|nr:23S rRNA (adenine(2503)-C(2))-methyltransferase RlmN [Francisellaceae bacterium]MBT6206842.1 23S rRNA (adenine(2503)-C(2))-methyltransferase RlmN [Francisellaceae bacterium]MBT6539190.1 23S rRNA (adenine(2503)-C(2))-methyltransferase RlmN [Francisellaceae bacterium]